MKQIFTILISFTFLFILASCSDLQTNVTPATESGIHGAGVLDTASQAFHANMLAKNNWQLKNCQECHSKNYNGGPSGVNCVKCHNGIGVHSSDDDLFNAASQNFHGKYFANTASKVGKCSDCHGINFTGGTISPSCAKCHATIAIHSPNNDVSSGTYSHGAYFKTAGKQMADCRECHGANYAGGVSSPACAKCHTTITVHQDGIADQTSQNFHGKYFKTAGIKMNDCSQCHGNALTGGKSSPSCLACHPAAGVHKDGISDPSSANFHGKSIKALGWNMKQCITCHGSNYAGGLSSPSCKTCHTQTAGPEACNTCHGNLSDPSKIAPPGDLNGNTSTSVASVGAHSKHLFDNNFGAAVACAECHKVPANIYDSGHMDGTTQVIFGTISNKNTVSSPVYSFNDNKCSNTYCHGGFKFKKSDAIASHQYIYLEDQITGNNFSPKWNNVNGTEAACGSCHGLPPKGHVPVDLKYCVNCHSSVINEAGQIINKTKHINGQIDMN